MFVEFAEGMFNKNSMVYSLKTSLIIWFAGLTAAIILALPPLSGIFMAAPVSAQRNPETGQDLGNIQPAQDSGSGDHQVQFDNPEGKNPCGAGETLVKTGVDFGCRGTGNSVYDLLFAILRFLTIGVGIVAILSLIWGGIEFTASQGDPQTSAKAINRMQSTVIALLLYLMIYAIINWLVPGGMF